MFMGLRRGVPLIWRQGARLSGTKLPFLTFEDPSEEQEFRRLVAAAKSDDHDHKDHDHNPSEPHDHSTSVKLEEPRQADSSTKENTLEVNGPTGPEPTRFGDWERKGRVSDF